MEVIEACTFFSFDFLSLARVVPNCFNSMVFDRMNSKTFRFALAGIVKANRIPASVACMPDFNKANHRKTPRNKKTGIFLIFNKFRHHQTAYIQPP